METLPRSSGFLVLFFNATAQNILIITFSFIQYFCPNVKYRHRLFCSGVIVLVRKLSLQNIFWFPRFILLDVCVKFYHNQRTDFWDMNKVLCGDTVTLVHQILIRQSLNPNGQIWRESLEGFSSCCVWENGINVTSQWLWPLTDQNLIIAACSPSGQLCQF